MTMWKVGCLAGIAAIIVFAEHAQAIVVLDQEFWPTTIAGSDTYTAGNYRPGGITYHEIVAQTFTVGVAGILDHVDLLLCQPAAVTADAIFSITGLTALGLPDEGTQLASGTIPASDIPTTWGSVSVDMSAFDLAVTPGTTVAFILGYPYSSYPTSYCYWGGQNGNPYAGGQAGARLTVPSRAWGMGTIDVGFRTYVNTPSSVPDAGATSLLLGFGIAGLIGVQRRLVA